MDRHESRISKLDPVKATKALEKLAPEMANIIFNSKTLSATVISKAYEKLDGDYGVLFEDVKDVSISEDIPSRGINDTSFYSALCKNVASRSLGSFESLVESIPYMNIGYFSPNYEESYSISETKFAVLNYKMDDQDLEFITAYDNQGNIYQLDAQNPPSFPVFLLGISERAERPNGTIPVDVDSISKALDDGLTNHDERVKGIEYHGPYPDPWPFQYPELYILVGLHTNGLKQYFASVDKKEHYYSFNKMIFSYPNNPENMYYKLEAWDEDVGTDKSYGISGSFTWLDEEYSIGAKVTVNNADDFLGSTLIHYWHAPDTTYSLGDRIDIKLSY